MLFDMHLKLLLNNHYLLKKHPNDSTKLDPNIKIKVNKTYIFTSGAKLIAALIESIALSYCCVKL